MIYLDIFKALNKTKIKYVVAGGLVASFYEKKKYYGELNLVICVQDRDFICVVDSFNASDRKIDEMVDVFLLSTPRFNKVYRGARKVEWHQCSFSFISKEDLGSLKRNKIHRQAQYNRLEYWVRNTNFRQRLERLEKSIDFIRSLESNFKFF